MRPFGTSEQLAQRRQRALDLLLVGETPTQVAKQLKTTPQSVRRWQRAFVVGTGGSGLYATPNIQPNSLVRNADANGVLKMTLKAGSYDWQFVPEAGKSFTDTGSTDCH